MRPEILASLVARAVLRVPDLDPRTDKLNAYEILFTIRPSWSRVGAYLAALPGGRFEACDFHKLISIEEYEVGGRGGY